MEIPLSLHGNYFQTVVHWGEKRSGEDLGGVERRENNQNIMYEKSILNLKIENKITFGSLSASFKYIIVKASELCYYI